jgi:hypothetical protein
MQDKKPQSFWNTKLCATRFDAPEANLITSEFSETYTATVYLMWNPEVFPSNQTNHCDPTSVQCGSISVPLGHVSWGVCGDAINTMMLQPSTGTNWTLNCSSETGPTTFVSDTTFPSWQGTIHGSSTGTGDNIIWVEP